MVSKKVLGNLSERLAWNILSTAPDYSLADVANGALGFLTFAAL